MDTPSEDEIDDFVKANDIDDRAAADLRECSADIQKKVLARGELSTARNPSAALLARIRDARAGVSGPSNSGGGRSRAGGSTPEVEEFIKHNKVDESAADSLRGSSPGIQRTVLSRGDLKTARNPSSALLARIRDAKAGIGGAPPPSGMPPYMPSPYGYPPPGYYPPGYPPGYPAYPYGYYGYPGYPPPPGYGYSADNGKGGRSRSRSRGRSSSSRSGSSKSRSRSRGHRREKRKKAKKKARRRSASSSSKKSSSKKSSGSKNSSSASSGKKPKKRKGKRR
eukprot:TRINITY_DN52994_c0_g1_i1.p1 TRINITY_DN52994_c0_g1~~TRINITY_DN52994_c0_g1_i1.p1  ORF type:complete len:281 (+),score=56.14 TRINITY_DN52994_c0_g1_i1:47-889(+)